VEYLVYAETGNTNIPNQIDEMAEREQDTQCFAWFRTRPKISRLEIHAALSLSINFLPVWLCTFPVTLNGIAIYWGFRLGTSCPTLFRINPFICDLFLIRIVYNPLMYSMVQKNPNTDFILKATYPHCGKLCFTFGPNFGG
jgi:hypothetical protein